MEQEQQPTWHPMQDGYQASILCERDGQPCLLIVYETIEQAEVAQDWLAGVMQ